MTRAIAALNDGQDAQLVTVADDLDLPVIAAFRLLAARLDPRHPILLKDTSHARATIRDADFLPTLLTAATNIGSLLCDGIGDAILVQGEAGAGPGAAPGLQHPPGRRHPDFQDRLRGLPDLRTDALQSPDHDRANQSRHRRTSRA